MDTTTSKPETQLLEPSSSCLPKPTISTATTTDHRLLGGGDKLKRDEWSEGAVSSLLEAYEAKWVLRNRAKLKGHDWEEVARFVSTRAEAPKTQTQCKNKIESMKKRYRSESSSSAASGGRSTWPLYQRIHLLLSGGTSRPAAGHHPQITLAASPSPPPTTNNNNPQSAARVLVEAAADAAGPIISGHPPPVQKHMMMHYQPPVVVQFPIPVVHESNGDAEAHPNFGRVSTTTKVCLNSQEGRGVNRSELSDSEDVRINDKTTDTDSSASTTPFAFRGGGTVRRSSSSERRKECAALQKAAKKRRSGAVIAENLRWLAEAVLRSEQARMETMRELEKMRADSEVRRSEIELQRTQIIANTQLQIAALLSGTARSAAAVAAGRNNVAEPTTSSFQAGTGTGTRS